MTEDKMYYNEASNECYTGCSEEDVELFIMSRLNASKEDVLKAMAIVGNDKLKLEEHLIQQGFKRAENAL